MTNSQSQTGQDPRKNVKSRQEEGILRVILESSPEAVWAVDKDLQLVEFNQAFIQRMADLGTEGVLRGDSALMPSVDEEENLRWLTAYQQVINGTSITLGSSMLVDQEIKYYKNTLTPLQISPTHTGILVQSRDVTMETLQKNEIERNQAQFEALSENLPLGIFIADMEGNFLWANAKLREMWQQTNEEILAQGYLARVHPNDVLNIQKSWSKIGNNKQAGEIRYRIILPDGSIRHMLLRGAPLIDKSGELYGFEGSVEDLTETLQLHNDLDCLLDLNIDMISTANQDGYFVLLNTAWERTLGYSLNELRSKPFIEFVHPEDKEATLLEVQKLYEQQTNVSFVNRYRTKSGEYKWLSWNAVVASGTELIYSITRDITKGKEEEEYLQMLESVVINGEDSVLITETDSIDLPGPRIVYANDAMCRMTGYKIEEIIGKTPRIFQGPLTEREPLEKIRKALTAWEPVNVELINHKKDGTPFYVNISIYPVANKEGWYTHWISIQRDITEKRDIDIQLKENEANLQALINNTQDIIFSIGRDKELLTFNQTFVSTWKERYGYLPERGHTFVSLWKDLPVDFWDNKLIEVFLGNPLLDQDVSVKGKDGIHYFRCSFNPIQNEGKVIGCTVFIKDITKQKNSELQLQASQSVMASLIDSQTSYLIRIDLEGYYSFANPAFIKKFGYGGDEDPPVHSRESVHPDDWPAVEEAVWFCLMNPGEMKSLEIRKPVPNGSDIWTEWEFVGFLDNEGNIGGIQAVGKDITDKKRTTDENKFLANILTKVNDSVVLTNLEGKIIYVNKGTENLWGYTSKELLGQYPNILFPKVEIEWMINIRKSLTKEKSYTGEASGLHKSGEEIFVLLETSILTDSDDVSIGFLSIAKDITQRKQAEVAIKVSEAHLRSMINATNHAFALLDLQGNIITFNNQAKEDCLSLFNYPLEKQQNLFAIFSRYPQEFIPYMVEQIVQGQTIAGVDLQKTIHGDDFWIDYLIAPARDDEGHVFGICINVTNITALKEAEQQVQSVNQRFRMAAESGNLGVWEWDILKSKLVWDEGMYNFFGLPQTAPTDPLEIWQSCIHPEDQGFLATYFPETLADPTKLEMDMDYRVVLPDGEIRFLRSPGHIVRNKEGQAISATGICFDISDMKTAEMELRRAKELAEEMNRLKSNFLANMSHEIRTPLNGILGLLPVLELEKDPEEINFMINMMQKSGQRLLSTLTGILELARLEAEQAEYRMEIIYLNDLVLDIFEALRSATIGRDFQYQLFQAESDTAVLADERLLSQILTNIIGNAIKFTQTGSVRISVLDKFHYKKHVYTAIRVEDTGVGIAQEHQNRIFDPFKQESEGSTRKFEGSGLGLSIAKKYTTMMGGDILLESEKYKGSIFTVYLPKQVS